MKKLNRRHFLGGSGALGLGAASGLAGSLFSMPALAADTTGYKALVCVFLFGGMDNHDTLLPYDQASWDQYESIREPLLGLYDGTASPRRRGDLLPLAPINAGDFGGREFALPNEMAPLRDLFIQGRASVVANVGPLIVPTTRTDFENDSGQLPRRLFSHNDQQSTWMASEPEGARFGWGGRFADQMVASNANSNPAFSSISLFGNSVFLSGEVARQYQLATDGPPGLNELAYPPLLGLDDPDVQALLEEHYRSTGASLSNLFERDVSDTMNRALDSNTEINQALDATPDLQTAFPRSFLGSQLRAAAEAISLRTALGARRQVFFVGMGGYDTHDNQANSLPRLQGDLSASIAAFNDALIEMGVTDDVTLFTASDFGRTLVVNGDGTDHGWGGHHFIMGPAAAGGHIYGNPPPPTLDHDQDSGNGRLIPTMPIEQYAATLGRWFGLTDSELQIALPGLSNFGGPTGIS